MGALSIVLSDPLSLPYLLKVKAMDKKARMLPSEENLRFCYNVLNNVSRSFSIVIQQLEPELRDAVCIFYLVLRGLDTVEDDMAYPIEKKVPDLRSFYKKIENPDFRMTDCGTGEYKTLMEQFPKVVAVYLGLKPLYRAAIADITKRMGDGMADFIEKEVVTVEDYNLYCHYVAGLVGIGLSALFASSGLEGDEFRGLDELSNCMGLFLQKTNIIRDYLEDIMEEPAPRMFWPRDVWGLYADELAAFKEPENSAAAVQCLNHLVTNALGHALGSLEYMGRLRNPSVFRFCAIPQIMAIATLAECYGNPEVFKRVVKIPKGQSARIMVKTNTMVEVAQDFREHARRLAEKVDPSDPSAEETLAAVEQISARCEGILKAHGVSVGRGVPELVKQLLVIILTLILAFAIQSYLNSKM